MCTCVTRLRSRMCANEGSNAASSRKAVRPSMTSSAVNRPVKVERTRRLCLSMWMEYATASHPPAKQCKADFQCALPPLGYGGIRYDVPDLPKLLFAFHIRD